MEGQETTPAKKKRKRMSVLTDSGRKRSKIESSRRYNTSRISIGAQMLRWNRLKAQFKLKNHAGVAEFLLDFFLSKSVQKPPLLKTRRLSSTPAKHLPGPSASPLVSEISAASSDSERTLSAEEVPGTSKGKTLKTVQEKAASSFINPFDVSIDVSMVTEEDEEDIDLDDPDYEPEFEMSAVLNDICEDYEEVAFEEVEFNMEREENEEVEGSDTDYGPDITRVTLEDCSSLATSEMCIAFVEQVKQLASVNVKGCLVNNCQNPAVLDIKDSFIGSALYLKWVCGSGHTVKVWSSQPVLNRRVHSGDFLSAVATVTSGNNFGKMSLWAQHLNLHFPSATFFHKVQRHYIVPTVDTYWEEKQGEVINSFQGTSLVVLGDGRNDSPGHSAQYCSYTLMEESTKKILTLQTLDKRTTDKKSPNMEKAGFIKAISDLRDQGVDIEEVVTDAHLGIGAVMKTQYPEMKHSHDIWHAAKNLGKKIMKVAKKKEYKVLIQWQKDILNHFWFTCQKATNYLEFLTIWRSLLHHITNQHSWILSHGTGINECLHEPLDPTEEREKQWLDPSRDQKVLQKLAEVMLDKRLLGKVHYYLNFRSTSELEVFHQLILMYCAKRFAYSPPVYRIRNRLAALDHNHHVDREVMRNKKGEIVYHRHYVKKSNRWSVYPVKVKKDYNYIPELKTKALVLRMQDRIGMKKKELEPEDPRRLSAHLAPVEPKPTGQLVAEKVSRFAKKD